MPGCIRIGTSGWNYDHWREAFYPRDLSTGKWFDFYSRRFETVEINNTFYHQPDDATYDHWRDQAPRGFRYAVKANRYITHMKKLKDPREPLERFYAGARRLKSFLGPVLFQLPPHWGKNLDRLETFCSSLSGDLLHAMEFRERDWLDDDVYQLLNRYGVCLCVHDMLPRHPRRVTGGAVYVRFHGASEPYGGRYGKSRLRAWSRWLKDVADERDVYAYFNNDAEAAAVRDAETLRELMQ